jgi:hypothetical protein
VLGVGTVNGRLLNAADLEPSAPPTAVIGHALWRRAFAADPAAIGTIIRLNGRPFTVVGVAPPRFGGLDAGRTVEVWTPLDATSQLSRQDRGLRLLGQLAPGVGLAEARAQLAALASRLAREFPDTNRHPGPPERSASLQRHAGDAHRARTAGAGGHDRKRAHGRRRPRAAARVRQRRQPDVVPHDDAGA